MGSKKFQVWLPLLLSVVMVAGMAIGYQLRERTAVANSFFQNNTGYSALQEIVSLIKNKYVDKVATDSLKDDAINDMLAHLDPHSVYIPPADLAGVNEDLQGNFQGIGIEFQIFDDTVNVINIIQGGPSEKAGMQIGDKILAVNDTVSIAGKHIKPDEIRTLLRGEGGTNVNLTVLRNSQQKKLTIRRGTIPVPSVDVSYVIAPQTGFIRINKFAGSTFEEFKDALRKLQQQHIQKLILDLRGNGGGFLNEAVDIADEFLDNDKLIVYTQGVNTPKMEYRCKREGLFEKGKLVVLVDETSASASEILSGALQDWDRATLIGRRTFGKGLVQQQYNLSDGGALRLTVARYYTPLGRNIQKPYNRGKEAYEEELIQRFHNGEMVVGDTTKPTTQAFKTPGGHLVYGGGGITPDIFVPFDTAAQPQPVVNLFYKGTLSNFVYHYYINNKSTLQNIKTPQQLASQFHPGNEEWQQLISFAKQDSIDLTNVSETVKADVLNKLPAYLARQMFRTEGYFEVVNGNDPMIKKALTVLQ
jgi:carboxyl-terminal processing protease